MMRSNVNLSIPGTHARLGDLVKDAITGFTGVISSHTRHLTGCDRVTIDGQVQGEEQKFTTHYCDVLSVEVIEVNYVKATPLPVDVAPAG